MKVPAIHTPTSPWRIASKAAALAFAAATVAALGAACSSGDSAGGAPSDGGGFGGGREVIEGEECIQRPDILTFGTFNPVEGTSESDFEPFDDMVIPRDAIKIHDGLASDEYSDTGTLVDMDTLTDEQNAQLDASYSKYIERVSPEEGSGLRVAQRKGFIVVYGEDSAGENWSPTDGVIDSKNAQFCVSSKRHGMDISSNQFIR